MDQQSLVEGQPDSGEFKNELARIHQRIAIFLSSTGQVHRAIDENREARSLWAGLARDYPDALDYRTSWRRSTSTSAPPWRWRAGKPRRGAEYRAGLAIARKLTDDAPAVTAFQGILASGLNTLGDSQAWSGELAGSLETYRQSLAILQPLTAEFPADTEFQDRLASAHRGAGSALLSLGRDDEAIGHFDQAAAILKDQVDRTPDLPARDRASPRSSCRAAWPSFAPVGSAEGEADIRRAVAIREGLAADFPRDPGQAIQVWRTSYDAGIELAGYLPPGRSSRLFEKVSATCRAWLDKDPKNLNARTYLAASLRNRAAALASLGRFDEAETVAREGLAIRDPLFADDPANGTEGRNLADDLDTLSDLLLRAGRAHAGRAGTDRAVTLRETLVAEEPTAPVRRAALARSLVLRAMTLREVGDRGGAESDAASGPGTLRPPPHTDGRVLVRGRLHRAVLASLAGQAGPAALRGRSGDRPAEEGGRPGLPEGRDLPY